MSDPIDLDLVELRCCIRKIKTRRTNRDEVVRQSGTHWSNDDLWVYVGKERTLLIATSDGVVVCGSDDAGVRDLGLLAPRWTLERLLSEPPEGWSIGSDGPYVAKLTWGKMVIERLRYHEVDLWISRRTGAVEGVSVSASAVGTDGLARLADRHKAVAELALILAEVEP